MKPVTHNRLSYLIFSLLIILASSLAGILSFPLLFIILDSKNIILKSIFIIPGFILSFYLFIIPLLFYFGILTRVLFFLQPIDNGKNSLLSSIGYIISTPLERFLNFLPNSLKILFIRFYGGKVGRNVKICMGVKIFNPQLIEIGDNVLVGGFSLLTPHLEETGGYSLRKIKIGSNVLVGGGTWILQGVAIGDNVIIGARSIIPKNKILPDNSIWIGNTFKR